MSPQARRRMEFEASLTVVTTCPLVLAAALVLNFDQAVLDGPLGSPGGGLVVTNRLTVLHETVVSELRTRL